MKPVKSKKGYFQKKLCECGKNFIGGGHSVRCPECRVKFARAYDHAYRHGIYLTHDTWRAYYMANCGGIR